MERLLQQVKKQVCILSFLFIFSLLYGQTPSVIRNIRIPLWAELDAYPELAAEQDKDSGQYDYPVQSIREVAPFLITGMVYGWKFSYTPSDKQRGVEEYLEIEEIVSSKNLEAGITYVSPWIQNNRLNCWCEFTRDTSQIQNYNLWSSIKNPVIHGIGYGDLMNGFAGLKDAAYDSVKNAVRDYYRSVIKNKPKEINGSVLIRDIPTVGISSGRYVIHLDFFLECGKIVEYSVY